jgi:hypothetical protein
MYSRFFESDRWKRDQATNHHGDSFSGALRALIRSGLVSIDRQGGQQRLTSLTDVSASRIAQLSQRTLRLFETTRPEDIDHISRFTLYVSCLARPDDRNLGTPADDRLHIRQYVSDGDNQPLGMSAVYYRRREPTDISPSGLEWRILNADPTNPAFKRLFADTDINTIPRNQFDSRIESRRAALALHIHDEDERIAAHEYLGVTAEEAVSLIGLLRYCTSQRIATA